MRKYVINEIFTDGYERFAVIQVSGKDVKLNVHFLEYDEFLENSEASSKKKKGDILEGDLSIELVSFSQKIDEELRYYQEIQKSSHIEAVVEVAQVIDEYSLYALSSILEDRILIEFESAIDYQRGDRILIIGSLEMNEKEEE